jgi:hypothetical protein
VLAEELGEERRRAEAGRPTAAPRAAAAFAAGSGAAPALDRGIASMVQDILGPIRAKRA